MNDDDDDDRFGSSLWRTMHVSDAAASADEVLW